MPAGLSHGSRRAKLLLADDERSIRESLRKLFQAEQYDVVLAANGEEAVTKFQGASTEIDLVLIDFNQPLGNRSASINRFRQLNPLLPILVLTRMPNQRAVAEASQVSALVEKPIDVPALLLFIRQLLGAIQHSQLQGLPPGRQAFQYLPSNQDFAPPHGDPYSPWA
jgi:DNA-binding response OmpR family regulator